MRAALAIGFATLLGCADEPLEFVCESDKQCEQSDEGLCVRQWCSYPDEGCDSGYRYTADADPDVAETCVPQADLPPA
ncbi:MAG: hypothetical protein AAGA54_14325 [Myxococcota bacterium]